MAGRPVDTVEPEFDFPVKLLEREGLKVIAIGVTQLLERILAHGGAYYFDAPGFAPDALIEWREE